jgi:hypothetical protein
MRNSIPDAKSAPQEWRQEGSGAPFESIRATFRYTSFTRPVIADGTIGTAAGCREVDTGGDLMKKTLIAFAASSVIAAASIAAPTPANAHAWWVAPAIIGGAIVAGAAIANGAYANPYYYGPGYYSPTVTVRAGCRTVRVQTAYGWRRVRMCG